MADLHPLLSVPARRATRTDLSLVAWGNREATSPRPGLCSWTPLLRETDTFTRAFLEAVLPDDALAWGKIVVIEQVNAPLAGGTGVAMRSEDDRPLDLDRLPRSFRAAYERAWPDSHDPTFAPQGPWILEGVAVPPEARACRLARPWLRTSLNEGVGFRVFLAYGADFSEDAFPGATTCRAHLDRLEDLA